MSMPFEPQVAGWIRWLEQRMDLKRRFLSLIVSHDSGPATGRLTVIARSLMPEDLLLTTPLSGSLQYVDDLCALQAPGGEGTENAPADPISVRAPDTWSDFVETSRTPA